MIKYTNTEELLLEVLEDGINHHKSQLLAVMPNDQASEQNLRSAICRLRKKLRRKGQDIICVFNNRRYYYRQVVTLASPYRG